MYKLNSEEQRKILFLINYDKSKTITEQSVIGAPQPSSGPTSPPEPQKTYQQEVDEWLSKYEQVFIPFPSKLYGNVGFLTLPKEARPKFATREEKLKRSLVGNPSKKISEYKMGFDIAPITLDEFLFKGQNYRGYFTVQTDDTLRFDGYGFSENGGGWYDPSDWVEPFPQNDKQRIEKTIQVVSIIELSTFIFGVVLAPFTAGGSMVLLAVSTAAGIVNAGLNFSIGNNFTGTLYLIFSFLGGYPLYKQILKKITQYSEKEIIEAVVKYETGKQLSKRESQIVKEVIEELTKNSKSVRELLAMGTMKTLLAETLAKYGIQKYLKTAIALGIGSIPILGVEYGLGEVWIALVDANAEEEIETNSPSRILWKKLWGDKKESGEEPNPDVLKEIQVAIEKKAEEVGKNNPSVVEAQELFTYNPNQSYADSVVNAAKKANLVKNPTPTYEQVLNNENNPLTNQPYIFEFGDKGEGIKKVKDLIKSKGLAKDTKTDTSDIYNENLALDIYYIQTSNNIELGNDIGSIIDAQTLKTIEKTK